MQTNEHLLLEMNHERHRGRLVPFLGSGLSIPVCRPWEAMVAGLERLAGIPPRREGAAAAASGDGDVIRRAARAVGRLRTAEEGDGLAQALRQALLESDPARPTAATVALVRMEWPLVLTTNYDDLYLAAAHEAFLRSVVASRRNTPEFVRRRPPLEVLGRSPSDCHRVLTALRRPAPPILWALQGFLPGQALIETAPGGKPTRYLDWIREELGRTRAGLLSELERELVVGHAEYRAVALRSESFRRAFAEVWRSSSLLFLGSGLRDRYLLDLFSQIIELYGGAAHPHYAVVPSGQVDVDFLRRYFGIRVVEIECESHLPALLEMLAASASRRASPWRWSYRTGSSTAERVPALDVSDGDLDIAGATSSVIVSGGGSGPRPRLSREVADTLVALGLLPPSAEGAGPERAGSLLEPVDDRAFTWVLRERVAAGIGRDPACLIVAFARLDAQSLLGRRLRPVSRAGRVDPPRASRGRLGRDLRLIRPVTSAALEVAANAGKESVGATLIASGALRSFPPSFVLQEMVRAWLATSSRIPTMRIVIDQLQVLTDLRSGRLDLAYFTMTDGCGEDAAQSQFWLEIAFSGGHTERFSEHRAVASSLSALLVEHSLFNPRWSVTVWPEPCLGWRAWSHDDILAWEAEHQQPLALETFGVTHGSTIRLVEAREVTAREQLP